MPEGRLLLTRPRLQSQQFASELTSRFGSGLVVVVSPVMEIEPVLSVLDLSKVSGLVFTSANAVRVASDMTRQRHLKAWCVGDRTAQAARDAGFEAFSAQGDLDALVRCIAADRPKGPLLHLHGEHVAGDLIGALARLGVTVHQQVIYTQRAQPLTAEAMTALAIPGKLIVPIFSPRAARLLRDPLRDAQANLLIAAMSPAVADEVSVQSARKVVVAQTPDSAAVMLILEQLLTA